MILLIINNEFYWIISLFSKTVCNINPFWIWTTMKDGVKKYKPQLIMAHRQYLILTINAMMNLFRNFIFEHNETRILTTLFGQLSFRSSQLTLWKGRNDAKSIFGDVDQDHLHWWIPVFLHCSSFMFPERKFGVTRYYFNPFLAYCLFCEATCAQFLSLIVLRWMKCFLMK